MSFGPEAGNRHCKSTNLTTSIKVPLWLLKIEPRFEVAMDLRVCGGKAHTPPVRFCLYTVCPHQKFSLHVNKPSCKQVQQCGVENWGHTASSSDIRHLKMFFFFCDVSFEIFSSDPFEDGQVSWPLFEVAHHCNHCHYYISKVNWGCDHDITSL